MLIPNYQPSIPMKKPRSASLRPNVLDRLSYHCQQSLFCRWGSRATLAMGQVQVVNVEKLDYWFPQQMGPGKGHFHARPLQRYDPAYTLLRRTRNIADGLAISGISCEQHAPVAVSLVIVVKLEITALFNV